MLSQTAVFRHLVRDHMGPAPVLLGPDATCGYLIERTAAEAASSAVVLNADNLPIGIVTEQDICRRLALLVDPLTLVTEIMSSPVQTIAEDDFLFHGIARMRNRRLRHMPVIGAGGEVVGVLQLHDALAVAAGRIVAHVEALTHEGTLAGMKSTKAAQVQVAAELQRDAVPVPDIQALLTRINNDLYRRVVELCVRDMKEADRGEPPVAFDVIVMGSGGRGESFLSPDQDNGFVLDDYPDDDHGNIDPWFIELGERMTHALNELGFDYCRGNVMATNPVWRKTLSQWRQQVSIWVSRCERHMLRYCDIFFDFVCVYGDGKLTEELREHVSSVAARRFFLREMYKVDEEHGVALGFFGRLQTNSEPGPDRGKINLKLTGTLPLVGAIRLCSLREEIRHTSTRLRIRALHEKGVLDNDEQDYLSAAFRHITDLLLRQQLDDFRTGNPVSNHVPPEVLTEREKDMLVNGFKAIRTFRSRLRTELSGELF